MSFGFSAAAATVMVVVVVVIVQFHSPKVAATAARAASPPLPSMFQLVEREKRKDERGSGGKQCGVFCLVVSAASFKDDGSSSKGSRIFI